ncbi:Asp23/Gls24 family envelope stress response protein [Corynebacterium tuberculostearicum]|uniref:Asp23/Gls24 family envelope stress response protein n=1 Tax=Corynebacterium TaxID=1716 RepID=UPI00195AAF4A|nr:MULTISPECIES: Asp23/Gls24 family envelope stress response protein [Corynebacterium]MCG7461859.1 Asp23/Gls24 family envelope stress response protein [Corynebacterium sp. ACRPF]MCG7464800.1 Asp23/Gls24 family envelope stress response protein [Corynebacterium sp. ACRPJ]MDV2417976.1 Asp23/Gls24 family envelope stress response protein [Corynebacterium tuberculostearicum]QRQ67319.1 Asp23/Gls24 family envelope stress response protein [Corynebacterium tuberculostearicum]WKE53206.1 Asp23/Gls24 famil
MSENKTPAHNTDNQVPASEEREVNNNLETQYGTTTIDDVVVSKIAGIAAREVSGVDSLGGGGARMIGNIRESFGASEDVRQGVDVEVEDGTARIEIAITAEYGVAIHELAEAIRRNIMNAVERMTGLSVERVNVVVHDVKLPKDESEAEDQAALNQGQA